MNLQDNAMTVEEKRAKATEVTTGRILTDEDFRRIDAAQLKKQVNYTNTHTTTNTVCLFSYV